MENSKICSDCQKEKPITDFYEQKDRKNGYSKCKNCHNTYCMKRWTKRKIDAITYKGNKCKDCTHEYPTSPAIIFDFHHLNPNEKDVSWDRLRLRSWNKIKEELDKCVLLCSNCHRIRHYLN